VWRELLSVAVSHEVRQIEPADPDITEEWVREIADADGVLDVEAYTAADADGWVVVVGAQEFFGSDDELGVEVRQRVQRALRAVPGASGVEEVADDEWAVSGTPSGEALTRAAVAVVDDLADRLRARR
jgi:hypothetical protein